MLKLASKALSSVLFGLVAAVALAVPVAAESAHKINKDADRVAISGYDTVAYFTLGQPVKGDPEFEHAWQDARWQFANAEHRDMFARDPERYAPRFGGFCTGGMAFGELVAADPEAWAIVDGKLYLNSLEEVRDELVEDPAPIIMKAEENWAVLGTPD